MPVQRVAVVFESEARPETTGFYCLRALRHGLDVEYFSPSRLHQIPRSGFDLYLNIDDGLLYDWPVHLRPSAFWAIDTHLDFPRALHRARAFDWVFAAQRDGADALRARGIGTAEWLPLACDPEIHRKHTRPKQHDFAFVGNLLPGERVELLGRLRRQYPRNFIGQCYFEEMAKIYSGARLVFNRSIRNDVNMRVFEAAACGSLLLTNDLGENGLAELFRDGVHLATYTSEDDLLDKAAYYLAREAIRERIAEAGLAEAHARHTYRLRMERIIQVADAGVPVSLRVAEGCHGVRGREGTYFEHARPELLALVPESARSILDIGCGSGRLGESIKQRQVAEVVGIELNPAAAERAAERIDRVISLDVESEAVDFPCDSFSAILCGDVLEHLREPGQLLKRARLWLKPGGCVVASIPNVRHQSVVASLLAGNWTYESAGLMDQDHLRFFTRREIEKLFYRAGYAIDRLGTVPGPGYEEWDIAGCPGTVRAGPLRISGLSTDEAREFYTYQYLIIAHPAQTPDYGTTSIVLVTHNEIEYTRACLESVRRMTDEPYEIIVVDNASTDGTVAMLEAMPEIRLIQNGENRGFPAAVNQGIAVAGGRQVLLLNNDTIVTTAWLDRMLRVLHSDPKIGLVGPCSNRVSGPQQIEVGYDELGGLDGFAWDWGKAHASEQVDVDRLVGFCLLIRREVIDAIGGMDEQFGVGCFEDDDYTLRARQAGFRTVIARDAFVHHFGGRTFLGSQVNFESIMRENQAKFRAKWGHSEDPGPDQRTESAVATATIPAELTVERSPHGGLLLVRKEIRLSLCMIVRNNAGTIRACLESVRPWVDEMVVVDTGSTDETPAIARSLGARLFHFPWPDSFSVARNESLRHARGEWIFWMDSDDTIDAENGRALRRLAYQSHPAELLGHVIQVHCPGGGEDGAFDVTVVDHVKLVRNRADLRFDGRIHEQLLPAIRAAGGEVAWSDVFVVHSGSDRSKEGQAVKIKRDLHLLHLELSERPDHPFTLFNLGMTYADCQRFHEAAEYLARSIAASGDGESHVRKAYALLIYAQMQLKRFDEAAETCREARAVFPEDAELRFRQGVFLHEQGCLAEAARAYRDVLNNHEERHFSSLDRGIIGFKARQNLAVVLSELGQLEDAEHEWRIITQEVPGYRHGWRGLGDVLLRQGRVEMAAELAEQLHSGAAPTGEGQFLAGRIAALVGNHAVSRHAFESLLRERPEDTEIRNALCQLLFENGTPDEAEAALKDLLQYQPKDASALHNLGTLQLRAKRFRDAVQSYEHSIRVRPDSARTHLQLGYALKGLGRIKAAKDAWLEALRLDGALREARDELRRAGLDVP